MNKRIFSLVCIVFFTLLAVSIQCSQQKESDARNKSVRGTKKINRINEKNDIGSKRETQLKNGNLRYDGTKEDLYGKLPSDLSSDEKIKIFLNKNNGRPIDVAEFIKFILVNGLHEIITPQKLDDFIIKHSIQKPNGQCWFSNYFKNDVKIENEQNNSL
ncbi:fam-c protein [Plasmodium vinckei]|uniref:Fam-c protein n=1 Tax=Plasmodium vinckei TaxID=5860 RepID=A0A6V7SCG6_PLAVN|nr:fam-c protein [Plasmodium vinckei]